MTITIFITNVVKKRDSNFLVKELRRIIPNAKINFDLDDCDRILRIESLTQHIETTEDVISCLHSNGFNCKLLTD